MGPALRLNLQLLICGLSLAAGLAPMKPGDYSISSRDPCPGKASDIENMNKMSSEQLCNKDERNCTVRLDGMQICIDDISACNLKQFPKLRVRDSFTCLLFSRKSVTSSRISWMPHV